MGSRLYWTSSPHDHSMPSEFITGRPCHSLYKPDPPRSLDDSDYDSPSSDYEPPHSPSSPHPGTQRHEYHSLKLLGEGAYGEVHLIRNPFNRKYIPDDYIALKAIDLEHRREDSKQKFRNELSSRRRGCIDVRRARDYFRQLIRGVDFLHSFHVVHRDLKPENVIVNNNGLLKITDFGMATQLQTKDDGTEVPLDRMCGTREFMSPQMFKKKYLYVFSFVISFALGQESNFAYRGSKNDVWATGIILLMMLTGRRPWKRARKSDRNFYEWAEGRTLPRPFDRLTPATLEIVEFVLNISEHSRPSCDEILDHSWLAL
ncbi:kinase domain protein [Necator americanus]|uniref:Kinase domain protein n=1 Tax=Necator americanus TaxID=51031 RepID=W2SKS9_NECAM|nr:kinase domain protein [Necator americanus]ETN70163.1 kinase domain protein [Necator americanus]